MLRGLQHLLETIYDAPSGHDVEQFLITRRDQLPRDRRQQAADEELVLVEGRRARRLALYIDEAVLQRLHAQNPLSSLHGGNIADFWTALEGVSHFSYLMWNAGHRRGVSRLELELQAEVDKYITSVWLLKAQNPGYFPRELRRALFERTTLQPGLDQQARQLYAAATRQAARFCAAIESVLASDRPTLRRSATAALRRFYRLGSTRKLAHIAALT